MFAKTPVKVGPSTIAVWICAIATAVVGAVQSGKGWMFAVSAGLVAINNVARSFQSIYEPELFFADETEIHSKLDGSHDSLYDDDLDPNDEGDEPHQDPNV